jgi:hypothetical protein
MGQTNFIDGRSPIIKSRFGIRRPPAQFLFWSYRPAVLFVYFGFNTHLTELRTLVRKNRTRCQVHHVKQTGVNAEYRVLNVFGIDVCNFQKQS